MYNVITLNTLYLDVTSMTLLEGKVIRSNFCSEALILCNASYATNKESIVQILPCNKVNS